MSNANAALATVESATVEQPTPDLFEAYQAAYQYFNTHLFGGRLPNCVLNFSRKSKAYGFFAPERWTAEATDGDEAAATSHEISINPDWLAKRTKEDVLSTLVHEMCHLEQAEFGTAPKRAYHNREWGAMMEAVGLIPSVTGQPGGRKTGASMTHYIDVKGRFAGCVAGAPYFPYVSSGGAKASRAARNKTKYACGCGNNIWGKPGLGVVCDECDETFKEVG